MTVLRSWEVKVRPFLKLTHVTMAFNKSTNSPPTLIEILFYHLGYLINQFMAEYTNQRKDKWGGDMKSRQQFPLEIIRRTKEAVGPKFILMYRLRYPILSYPIRLTDRQIDRQPPPTQPLVTACNIVVYGLIMYGYIPTLNINQPVCWI